MEKKGGCKWVKVLEQLQPRQAATVSLPLADKAAYEHMNDNDDEENSKLPLVNQIIWFSSPSASGSFESQVTFHLKWKELQF